MHRNRVAATIALTAVALALSVPAASAGDRDYKQKCVQQTVPGPVQPPTVCVLWLLDE